MSCTPLLRLALIWISLDSLNAFGSFRCRNGIGGYQSLFRKVGPRRKPIDGIRVSASPRDGDVDDGFIKPDYLITDSVDLEVRPSLIHFLLRPRNLLALVLTTAGTGLTAYNVFGTYNDGYVTLQQLSVYLALVSAMLDFQAVASAKEGVSGTAIDPRYRVSPNVRCGCSDDALVHLYAATYTAACAWLALRTCVACPPALVPWDVVVGPSASLIFILSLLAPASTLLHHYQVVNLTDPLRLMVKVARQEPLLAGNDSAPAKLPLLTLIELFRAQSLMAIGIIGCIFAPETIIFLVKGQDWWLRASDSYRGQPWIESTNALFGVYATQLSMIAHRAGKQGVATYATIVPAFTLVCVILTVVPSACSLYWWGDQVSFFDFYSV